MGHINTLDMGLSGMMTVALCSLIIAQRDDASEAEQRNYMLLCWAGMALATMSKGLIGFVLPGAVWFSTRLGRVILVMVASPWARFYSSLQSPFPGLSWWQADPEHPHFFFIRTFPALYSARCINVAVLVLLLPYGDRHCALAGVLLPKHVSKLSKMEKNEVSSAKCSCCGLVSFSFL